MLDNLCVNKCNFDFHPLFTHTFLQRTAFSNIWGQAGFCFIVALAFPLSAFQKLVTPLTLHSITVCWQLASQQLSHQAIDLLSYRAFFSTGEQKRESSVVCLISLLTILPLYSRITISEWISKVLDSLDFPKGPHGKASKDEGSTVGTLTFSRSSGSHPSPHPTIQKALWESLTMGNSSFCTWQDLCLWSQGFTPAFHYFTIWAEAEVYHVGFLLLFFSTIVF